MNKFLILSSVLLLSLFNYNSWADEGMWIPLYLGELNEAEMQAMGMNITAEEIYSVNRSSLKDAIVIFGGGCTGELVSDQGLILTNHHCGYSRIQKHSSVEHDYLTDGFWAMDMSQELPNPGLTVTFLVRMEEVTDQVLEVVDEAMTEVQRNAAIRTRIDSLEKKAVKDNHYKAVIKPFYYGN
ncbi:MAG: S46 family peptidase, partial [Bacteroidales bacterium]|nr:S46 family peptidase [Bacteroidales bacterium]